MSAPLAPCPFCKGTDIEVSDHDEEVGRVWHSGWCKTCGCRGPLSAGSDKREDWPTQEAEAAKLWNERGTP